MIEYKIVASDEGNIKEIIVLQDEKPILVGFYQTERKGDTIISTRIKEEKL